MEESVVGVCRINTENWLKDTENNREIKLKYKLYDQKN